MYREDVRSGMIQLRLSDAIGMFQPIRSSESEVSLSGSLKKLGCQLLPEVRNSLQA